MLLRGPGAIIALAALGFAESGPFRTLVIPKKTQDVCPNGTRGTHGRALHKVIACGRLPGFRVMGSSFD